MKSSTERDGYLTSRNFLQDRSSHLCRREHDWSLRHQRLSLDLIAGDYKNMGCRGELTSGVAKGIDADLNCRAWRDEFSSRRRLINRIASCFALLRFRMSHKRASSAPRRPRPRLSGCA